MWALTLQPRILNFIASAVVFRRPCLPTYRTYTPDNFMTFFPGKQNCVFRSFLFGLQASGKWILMESFEPPVNAKTYIFHIEFHIPMQHKKLVLRELRLWYLFFSRFHCVASRIILRLANSIISFSCLQPKHKHPCVCFSFPGFHFPCFQAYCSGGIRIVADCSCVFTLAFRSSFVVVLNRAVEGWWRVMTKFCHVTRDK